VIVVADTSPINYLVLIGHEHVLADLFGEVVVPEAVFIELQSGKAPEVVRNWVCSAPGGWFRVERLSAEDMKGSEDPSLHKGEQEAIALAKRLNADYLVIDEKVGRRAAVRQQLAVIGTLGILERADLEGLIEDFPGVISHLDETTFHMSSELKESLLRRHRERSR
jgi:predicted nucleic acid-binding protein